jgi:NAD(P)-dependent dehydrogenase (short-subunit alcohol dehydrogenase family)
MIGKRCMVTGATSGLGFATALALAHQGAEITVVGRNSKKCEKTVKKIMKSSGNNSIRPMIADLSSQKDIRTFTYEFKKNYTSLDVLVNNAGAKFVERKITANGLEMTFALNHLGYFLLTNLLLETLKKSQKARIVNVSSGAHYGCKNYDFDNLQGEKIYDGRAAYALSKLSNVLFTYELARRLSDTDITVNALDPGGVATNFSRNNGLIKWAKHIIAHLLAGNLVSPQKGARTIVYLATSPEVEGITGKYFYNQKPVQSSDLSYDETLGKKLWDVSLELTAG